MFRGDFNVTRFPSERSGSARLDHAMEFSDFISELGLMDLPLAGGSFTWSISQDPPLWSRIDRFLVSLGLCKSGCCAFVRIISQFFLIWRMCLGGEGRSNLRICGLKWRGLWIL